MKVTKYQKPNLRLTSLGPHRYKGTIKKGRINPIIYFIGKLSENMPSKLAFTI